MEILKNTNNALRFLLEVAAIVAIAYWGLTLRSFGAWRYAVAIGLSLLIILVWGLWGAPMASFRLDTIPRLLLEILIFSSAVAALFASGQKTLAGVMASIVVINTFVLYLAK